MVSEAEFLRAHLERTLIKLHKQALSKQEFLSPEIYLYLNNRIETLRQVLRNKPQAYSLLRTLYADIAGLVTSTEWQSPSFTHSMFSEAGLHSGLITGNITDYTRDQLVDGNALQKRYAKEFIGSWHGIPIEILFTQSGMAALTTILTFLERKRQFSRPVILGKNSYFQNKELIYYHTNQDIIEVDEHDTAGVCNSIDAVQPGILFFDSLCNASDMAMPDLFTICRYLQKHQKQETYLVIDNTCLATGFKPLELLGLFAGKVKLLVFESLNKYYQYGMDRTIGGFCWGLPQDAAKLFYCRLHAGTILSDISTAMLPPPSKTQLKTRLRRLQQNTQTLAEALAPYGANCPGLTTHPANTYAIKRCSFWGSILTLTIPGATLTTYKRIVARIFSLAKKRQVPLVQGTSFGLDTTRIYMVATHTAHAKPFLRIAVGTENATAIEAVKKVIVDALRLR